MSHSGSRDFRPLAAACFVEQLAQLSAQLEGIRHAQDVECVHAARVASRRLRAALGVFGESLPAKKSKRWRKAVRRLTRALGQARDCDVQIDFLARRLALASCPQRCRGIAIILTEVEQERAACQAAVLREIDRFRDGRSLHEMLAMARRTLDSSRGGPSEDGDPALADRGEAVIAERFDAVLEFEDSLQRPEDVERHHAMRIAAKRLRYTMETLAPVIAAVQPRIEAARRLQNLLGEVHDCDVWINRLACFDERLGKWRRRCYDGATGPGPWKAGLKHLGKVCRKRRGRVFEKLVGEWPRLRDDARGVVQVVVPPSDVQPLPPAASAPPEDAGQESQVTPG